MASSSPRTYTVDDLYRMPDDGCRYELSHGWLVREPTVGARHGYVVTQVAHLLRTWADESGAGAVLTGDVGFVLARDPDTVRAPDIAFVGHDRCPDPFSMTGPVIGPPDLAVEVLSPSDGPARLRPKLADYRRAGTPLVWLVDPAAREVRVCEQSGTDRVFLQSDRLSAPDVLPGFVTTVAALFL